MASIVGDPVAVPALRHDAGGLPYFSFRLREYRYGRWKSNRFHNVHAYIPQHLADLVSPGHLIELEGDHIEQVRTFKSLIRIDTIFRADAAFPREQFVPEPLPDKSDLGA